MSDQHAAFDRAIKSWNAGDLAGRRVSRPGFTILRFDGEQVVERYSVADFASVIAQISAP